MKQLFILGVSRTGSKFYMQLLNTHKDISIAPELIFRHPVKKDVFTLLESTIKSDDSVEVIVHKLFDFKERVPFTRTVSKIGQERLIEGLNMLEKLTPYTIFDCIIKLSAEIDQKSIYGAKFPVHYKYSEELIDYYGNSKVLFLTRDPRAIYASDAQKKKKESQTQHYRFKVKYFIRFFVLFYTIIEWRMSLKVYEKCKRQFSSDKIKLMKYENVINDEVSVINDISNFIGCSPNDFNKEQVRIVDSSYSDGISADRWKNYLSSFDKSLFKILIGRKMKKYGYS